MRATPWGGDIWHDDVWRCFHSTQPPGLLGGHIIEWTTKVHIQYSINWLELQKIRLALIYFQSPYRQVWKYIRARWIFHSSSQLMLYWLLPTVSLGSATIPERLWTLDWDEGKCALSSLIGGDKAKAWIGAVACRTRTRQPHPGRRPSAPGQVHYIHLGGLLRSPEEALYLPIQAQGETKKTGIYLEAQVLNL